MKIQGTIQHNDLEGGFWQLVADDGQAYTIGSKLSQPALAGKRVEIEGEIINSAGIYMAGPSLHVVTMTAVGGDGV